MPFPHSLKAVNSNTISSMNSMSSMNKMTMPFSSQSFNQTLHEQGILDDNNLLHFDTLYELQARASVAFAENPLFGTYTEKGEGGKPAFEFMSYKEYGDKVTICRSVLKDLGKWLFK